MHMQARVLKNIQQARTYARLGLARVLRHAKKQLRLSPRPVFWEMCFNYNLTTLKPVFSVIRRYPRGGCAASSPTSSAESADSQGRGAILLAVQLLLLSRGERAVGSEAAL